MISKWFLGVFDFLQKMNENKSTWGIIIVKSNSFVRFLEEIEDTKKPFRNYLTFNNGCLMKISCKSLIIQKSNQFLDTRSWSIFVQTFAFWSCFDLEDVQRGFHVDFAVSANSKPKIRTKIARNFPKQALNYAELVVMSPSLNFPARAELWRFRAEPSRAGALQFQSWNRVDKN